MQLATILQPSAVKVLSGTTSKKRLLQELAEIAAQSHGMCSKRCIEALLEREALGPTGVGRGVALPHARLPGLDRVVGIFLKLEKPIDYDSVDRQPVDLIFALLAPENSGVDHLKALASVSRTMRDAGICAKLRANDDISILHTVLTEQQGIKAA